jgi:hypothetical protein
MEQKEAHLVPPGDAVAALASRGFKGVPNTARVRGVK